MPAGTAAQTRFPAVREGGVGEWIRAAAAVAPETTAVFVGADGTSVVTTLAGLLSRAETVAGGLQALGVRPGDVVAVQLPADRDGTVAQAAVLLCGAVLLPVVPGYGTRELGFVLRQSGARVVVLAAERRGLPAVDLLAALGDLPELRHVVTVGPGGWSGLPTAAVRSPNGYRTPTGVADTDRCLLVYTSGTTADPKGVQHSHRTVGAELATMGAMLSTGPAVVHLAVFPPGHVAGFLGTLRLLVLATPTIALSRWDAAVAARLIARHGVTSSVGAPVHLAGLLDAAERDGLDLRTLREYMLGAASVPPALVARADALGIRAFRTYGSSEHPTISSGSVTDPFWARVDTDGRPLPGTEVRVVDETGADLPTGVDGEIVTRGPEQFLGYLDPTAMREAYLAGGWLRSGDLGHLDVCGYLTVTDRLKDVIVRGGENISSREVEDLLAGHPAIVDVAAVGAPDHRYGERVCAVVVVRPGATFTVADADAHFRALGVARHKTPERVVVVDALPRTPSGKTRKAELRARL